MNKRYFLAFDLGASSGRAILGELDSGRLKLTEVHRFRNQMLQLHGSFYWNIFSLFEELKTGLKKCISDFGIQPESVGIDTWGVDYSLVTPEGQLAGLPYAYRDHRTDTAMEEFFKLLPSGDTYMMTGIQFMQFNTLFQLFASAKSGFSQLKIAESLLFTPDTLNYLFTGQKKIEYTIASTSQMLVPGRAEWQFPLFDVAGIPRSLVGEIILPGTKVGDLLPEVCLETGSKPIPCVAIASHDTASAVVSVPAEGKGWAFISSGTWSLMGVESPVPIVNEKTLELNYTNEGGVEGTTRFLKNIMGMWLIQECKRMWDKEKEITWDEIVDLSREAESFRSLINPDDPSFLNPGDMPAAIQEYCKKTGQPVPVSKGEIARCIYDSLVLKYKYTLGQIESATGEKISKIHIIGGGAHNREMNRLTADATGIPVYAGPTEATSIGNILMQAKGLGVVGSLAEIREIVKNSFEIVKYEPSHSEAWEEAFEKFSKLM